MPRSGRSSQLTWRADHKMLQEVSKTLTCHLQQAVTVVKTVTAQVELSWQGCNQKTSAF